jgi:hypothetical protein
MIKKKFARVDSAKEIWFLGGPSLCEPRPSKQPIWCVTLLPHHFSIFSPSLTIALAQRSLSPGLQEAALQEDAQQQPQH